MTELDQRIDPETMRTVTVNFQGAEETWVVARGAGEYAVHAFLFHDNFDTLEAAKAMAILDAMRDDWLSLIGPGINASASAADNRIMRVPNLFGRWRAFEPPVREEVASALEMGGNHGAQ